MKPLNKKSQMSELAKIILWTLFFLGAVAVTYFIIKFFNSLI